MFKVMRPLVALLPIAGLATPLSAEITGVVLDEFNNEPIEGARVRIQTTLGEPAITDPDGRFVLDDTPGGPVEVTAVVSYDSQRAVNYITRGAFAVDGDDITIFLTRTIPDDHPDYQPGSPLSDCSFCHQDQTDEWLLSTHSNAAQNEWVLDLFSGTGTPGGDAGYVFRDTHDEDDTGFCATCHAPLEDALDPGNVFLDEVDTAGGLFGVSCLGCHQMAEVNEHVSALHHLGNTQYRFPNAPDAHFWVWGPLDDVSFSTMRASHQPQFSQALFCASCHEYDNPDTGAPGQTTYSEWLAGPYADPDGDFRVCQDCHMPPAEAPGPISSLGGQPIRAAEQRRNHEFVGATPATLSDAIHLDLEIDQQGGELVIDATVTNAGAGHNFPTGISIRNAILVIAAETGGEALTQTAGPTVPFYGSTQDGDSADDLAGLPGKGFARVLEGRINGQGPVVRPVLFIDAEGVWEDTTIPAGQSDTSRYRFALGALAEGAQIEVQAELRYRRAWRDLAVTKGWTQTPAGGPIEIQVAAETADWTVTGTPPPALPVPSLDHWALLMLATGLALLAFAAFRQRPRTGGDSRAC